MIALLLKEHEDGSGAWIWECDARGRLTRVAPKVLAMLPERAARGRHLSALALAVPADRRERVREEVARALAAGRPFHDLLIPVGSGEEPERWLAARGRPQRDEDGRLRGYRGLVTDVTEAKLAEDRVRFLASHDALTELPNRVTYAAHMKPWAAAGRRFASLHVDLDRFKLVNDTLGHGAGDELLMRVAGRLRAAALAAHPEGIAARVGGDEFMACVPLDAAASPDDDAPARALAAAIVAALAEPFDFEAGRVTVGASVGLAVWPDDGDLGELANRVDLALYRAKEGGRGQFRRYEASMDRRARDRKAIEAGLRTALARGELHLVFQPLVDLSDGRASGVEALLRWTHPELGAVSPATFIPVAEESGAIAEIGAWVLREACREAAGWDRPLPVAVNVSARQVLREDFVPTVLGALAASGLAPERLELTESILIEDADAALAVIEQLRWIGCRVVLDDFGTGYSSLSYLRTFVFDKIKIDRSFVASLREEGPEGRPGSSTLVEAIVGLARTLGMQTTAEGIEEDWQAEDLRRMGCEQGQGFLFARPLSAASLGAVAGTGPEAAPRAAIGGARPAA